MQDPSFHAVADIPVSVFVKRDTASDFGMKPCVAGDIADVGVSHQGTQDTQLPGTTGTPIAAIAGTSCKIYGLGKTCEVIAGAAITAGAKLKPDANAHAVAATAGDEYSAIANQTVGTAGERVSVTIHYGTTP